VGTILDPMEGFLLFCSLGMTIFDFGWIWFTLWTVLVE